MDVKESLGRVLGASVAPLTFLGGLIRRDRLFHPDGVVHRAEVGPLAQGGPLGALAQRLAGTALVRLSGGFWKWPQGKHVPDVLGAGIRFRSVDDVTPKRLPGDQDLLFATSRTLQGIPAAMLRTNVNDFLSNDYYAILPFALEGAGKVYLRLVPMQGSPAGPDRHERLALAAAQGKAVLRLELQAADGGDAAWIPIAAIELRERLAIADDELALDTNSSAAGLVPDGLLQRVRPAAYAASQAGRRLVSAVRGRSRGEPAPRAARGSADPPSARPWPRRSASPRTE